MHNAENRIRAKELTGVPFLQDPWKQEDILQAKR